MHTISAAIVLIICAFILWGVGEAIQRVARSRSGPWPVSIGIGLAANVAIGGIFNLAHIAYAPALWTLAGAELLIASFQLRRIRYTGGLGPRQAVELVSAGIIIGAVTIFAITTQLPPKTFNSHDDFEKYFAYPVRMLETGTLAGSPLSALGSETLGGQQFLHGFVASVLPIPYINGVDAIFCMAVLMVLASAAGWRRFPWFPGTIVGPLLVAAIDPQYVNVSAFYSGTVMMATAVMAIAGNEGAELPSPWIIGLLYASMVALKPTFALFPACQLAFILISSAAMTGSGKKILKWTSAVVGCSALFLSPWILLHAPVYFHAGSLAHPAIPSGDDGSLSLLSPKPLFWGDSFLHYTVVVAITGLIAILGLMEWFSEKDIQEKRKCLGIWTASASGVVCYFLLLVLLAKMTFGYATNLRYAIPFILGACIPSLSMASAIDRKWNQRFGYLTVAASLAISVAFLPSLVRRYQQATQFGSILAFSDLADTDYYARYNAFWLSPGGRQYIAGLQDKVPPGEPLLAWINTPFLLDYKRNEIIDADVSGVALPWASVPADVHYVLWQYAGPEVRMEGDFEKAMHGPGYGERLAATRSFAFANRLSKIAQKSEVIAADKDFVLFKVNSQM